MNKSMSVLFYVIIIFSASILAFLSQVNLKEVKLLKRNTYINLKFGDGSYYNKTFMYISFVCLTLPVAFRHYTGADYGSYVEMYNNISRLGPFAMIPKYEIGYVIFNYLCSVIFNDYHSIFIIIAFLTNIFIYKGILYERKKINLGIAIFAYGFTLYFMSFVIIRNTLGIAIVFYGYRYLLERKLRKFFIIVTIACMFHYSLAFYYIIGIIFLERLKKSRVRIAIGLAVSMIVLPYVLNFFFNGLADIIPRLSHYSKEFLGAKTNISLYAVAYSLPLIPFTFNYKKLIKQNANNYFYFYLYCLSILVSATSNPLITRFIYALWPALIILVAGVVKLFDRNKILKIISVVIIILYGTSLIVKFVTLQSYYLIPYKYMFEIY